MQTRDTSSGPIPPSLTEDGFLGSRLRILQPEKGFRAGIDSVFLAAAVPCEEGQTVFEVGVGTGVAALCLAARCRTIHVTGIEIAARHVMLAQENARRNDFAAHLRVLHIDAREALSSGQAAMPPRASFDHAMANPPFFEEGKSTPSPNLLKAQSHGFGPDDLGLWVRLMHAMIRPRGTVTMINRAEALGQMLAAMEDRFGDIRVAPLFPRAGAPATRVIVQAVKGTKAPLQLLPGLVLHGEGNGFTLGANAVLREGLAFPLR